MKARSAKQSAGNIIDEEQSFKYARKFLTEGRKKGRGKKYDAGAGVMEGTAQKPYAAAAARSKVGREDIYSPGIWGQIF